MPESHVRALFTDRMFLFNLSKGAIFADLADRMTIRTGGTRAVRERSS
jgi:hypothetical protein